MGFYSIVILLAVSAILQCSGRNDKAHSIQVLQDAQTDPCCTILNQETLSNFKGFGFDDDNDVVKIKTKSAMHIPPDFNLKINKNAQIVEIIAKTESIAELHLKSICPCISIGLKKPIPAKDNPEIRKIVDNGDQMNRIDVVFMGDGYTAPEREKFFQDIGRLTQDMFEGTTFSSYLPLFNIWAIYVESVDSGIGYNGGPLNTPFKLYREQGQLRVIWPGDPGRAREVCALTGVSGCDYPSLIANDDFYGGLGGEFVVSTRSPRTGTIVLRHEMGHNFADVGDEYDNSWAYFGANNAATLSQVRWTQWLTNGTKEERVNYRLLEYPWFDLSKGNQTFTFYSDGLYSRWYLLLSVSAAGEADSLEFLLDGQPLPWTSTGFDDREFYDWSGDSGFAQGNHTFTILSKTAPTHPDIPRMICSVVLHEYGNENEYHTAKDYYSAYPTWDDSAARVKTYRPTNGGCLMRNMTHSEFCSVCKESMWLQFLERISLIDGVEISPVSNPNGKVNVTLHTLELGQLRQPGNEILGEKLNINWLLNGAEEIGLRDHFHIEASPGRWIVQVELISPEVRSDPDNLLKESYDFIIFN
jgi:hypothetical protein